MDQTIDKYYIMIVMQLYNNRLDYDSSIRNHRDISVITIYLKYYYYINYESHYKKYSRLLECERVD